MNQVIPLDVSVVIPAYNRAQYIGATLDSVAAQTCPPREVIVVDDGSGDDTAAVAERDGVRVIRQPNRGIGAARNVGIDASTGEWLAFLDSDDLWIPEKLEVSAQIARLCPAASLIFSDMEQFQAHTGRSRSFLAQRENFLDVEGTAPAPDVLCCDSASLAAAFHRGNFINPSTMLVRRDLLQAAGKFDETLDATEDREYVLRLLRHARVAVSRRQLVRYRMHEAQFSSDSGRMLNGVIQVAERVFDAPDHYPPGTVKVYREQLPAVRYALGVIRMEEGDFKAARNELRRSLSERMSGKTLTAYLVALGGPAAYGFLRGVKRHLDLPGLTEAVGARDFGAADPSNGET